MQSLLQLTGFVGDPVPLLEGGLFEHERLLGVADPPSRHLSLCSPFVSLRVPL